MTESPTQVSSNPPSPPFSKGGWRWIIPPVACFWLLFYLAYPYRFLHDDSTFSDMLHHRYFIYHPGVRFSRLLHDALIYLQGYLDPSMEKAVLVSLLGHLLIGWVTWRFLIPRMKPAARFTATAGLVAFILHPVSLQTVVHVSQRGEILGTLFMASALAVFLDSLQSGASPRRFVLMTALSAAAMASKESAAVVPIALTLILALRSRSRAGWAALGAAGIMLAAGVFNHPFSKSTILNEENYRRSAAFHEAVFQGRETTNEDSLFYPLRTPTENVRLQTALVPLILKDIFFPFAVVKDYGHFPLGRQTYTWKQPWIWVGIMCLILGAVWLFRRRRTTTLPDLALLVSPLLLYAVYWVTISYDPLMLYRLYGVVFLAFVVSLPSMLSGRCTVQPFMVRQAHHERQDEARPCTGPLALSPSKGERYGDRSNRAVVVLMTAAVVLAGIVRAWEMADGVRETRLELARQPYNFRLYAFAMQERVRRGEAVALSASLQGRSTALRSGDGERNDRPVIGPRAEESSGLGVDCRAALAPAVRLAPSTSAIYVEWAWCLAQQGRIEEAREFARKSLEQESVEGYVRMALDYLMTPEGAQLDLSKIHPFNRNFLPLAPLSNPPGPPSGSH